MKKTNGFKIGVDMGGTNIKLALLDEHLRFRWSTVVDNRSHGSAHVLVNRLAKALQGHLAKVRTIGMGVAGDVDPTRGFIRFSPNLGLKNTPLGKLLQKALKRKIVMDNDANAAAWGIYRTGVPPKTKNVVVLTLGTGVGGGLILNGQLYRGSTGSAGEIGHMTLVPEGRLCHCGNKGCLETYIGGTYLVREAISRIRQGEGALTLRLAGGHLKSITPRLLNLAAKRGDPMAKDLWREAGQRLGQALANLINVFNPELIVLCGGLASAKDLFLPAAKRIVLKTAFKTPAQAAHIQVATHAKDIGVIGAALLATESGHPSEMGGRGSG